MKCFLYIVQCRDRSYYTGITSNLERRLYEHNNRIRSSLQKAKVPVMLKYWEVFDNRQEAAKRERIIKGWRREKKEILIGSLH